MSFNAVRQKLRLAKDRTPPGVSLQIIELDVELAKLLLATSNDNRVVKPTRILSYSKDIGVREWPFTGDTIVLSPEGILLDGQHRCLAVIESGVSIITIIVCGVDANSFPYIDRGAARSLADSLHISGYEDAKNLSAAINIAYNLNMFSEMPRSQAPPIQTALKWFDDNQGIVDCLDSLRKYRAHKGGMSKPQCAGLMYHAAEVVGMDQVEEFLRLYLTLEMLPPASPVMALHETYQFHSRAPGTRLQQDLVIGWAIMALNDWMEGIEKRGKYRVPARGGKKRSAFPRVVKPAWMVAQEEEAAPEMEPVHG